MAATNKTRLVVWAAVVAVAILLAGLAYLRIAPGIVDTNTTQAKQQLIALSAALEKYKADHGRYPSQEEGLRALLDPSPKRGYLSEFALKDPWGRPFMYRVESSSKAEGFTLYSLGRDGLGNGQPNEDLVVHN